MYSTRLTDHQLSKKKDSDYEWVWVITNDYKWSRVTTSDCHWLRVRLRGIASQTSSYYKWLQVTTIDYKWLRVTQEFYTKGWVAYRFVYGWMGGWVGGRGVWDYH